MIVTIHQPEHLPWLGFFHKILSADLFVVLDNVQYRKNYFQNRNRIFTPNGPVWVTVPVRTKGHTSATIAEMKIAHNGGRWQRKYWKTLEQAYKKHPYYELYAPGLREILFGQWDLLADLNMALIEFLLQALGREVKMLRASHLGVEGTSSRLLLEICRQVGASTYLSGPSGRDYLDESLFHAEGIDVRYHDFQHPVYPQKGAENFIPNLSVVDLLMNAGASAVEILGV